MAKAGLIHCFLDIRSLSRAFFVSAPFFCHKRVDTCLIKRKRKKKLYTNGPNKLRSFACELDSSFLYLKYFLNIYT
jgi:hypothetical protein